MGVILAKYQTALTIQFPLFTAGTRNFATSSDWTPATGDVKQSIDGQNVVNTTNLPVAVGGAGSALWSLTLTAGELTGQRLTVQLVDSATKAIDDNALIIETYGNASAQHPFDLGTGFLTQMTLALTTGLTEGYAADGAIGSVRDHLYFIVAMLSEWSKSGMTLTAKKLDGTTPAATFTLDDATNPTSITRTT